MNRFKQNFWKNGFGKKLCTAGFSTRFRFITQSKGSDGNDWEIRMSSSDHTRSFYPVHYRHSDVH